MTLLKGISRETRKEYWMLRQRCKHSYSKSLVEIFRNPVLRMVDSAILSYEYAGNEYESYYALGEYWRKTRQAHLMGAITAREASLPEDFVDFLQAADRCTQLILKYDRLRETKDPYA